MSIVAGYYAQVENVEKAIIWTNIIYFLWLAFTFLLGCMVLLAGLRLLRLLKNHLSIQKKKRYSKEEKEEENQQKMKLGVTKVKLIISIGCTSLWVYSIMIAIYITSRHSVMSDTTSTIVFTAFAYLNGPLASNLIQLAILMDLKLFRGLSYLSFTSTGTSSFSIPTGSAAYNNNYNTDTYMSETDHPHHNTTTYDGIVEATDAPEFISMDQWNQIFNNENNIESLPIAQQQRRSKFSSFGHVLSTLSPMQQKQSYIMMDNGVDNRSSSSLSYSNLEKGRY